MRKVVRRTGLASSVEWEKMRQAHSGHQGYGAFGSVPAAGTPEGDRLSHIRRAIDSIEQRLDATASMGAHAPYAPPGVAAPAPVNPAAYAPYPAPPLPPLSPAPAMHGNQLGVLQEELRRLSSQIMGAPQAQPYAPAAPMAPLSAPYGNPAAEIAARQQALRSQMPAQQQPETGAAPDADQQANAKLQQIQYEAITGLTGQLQELKSELAGLKQEVAKPKVPQEEIDRIANAVSDLQQGSTIDEAAFNRLQDELDTMREKLAHDVQNSLRSEIQTSSDHASGEMNARLEALAQGIDSMSLNTGNSVAPLVDNLAAQLDTLRMSVEDLPQTLAMSRVEDRLGEMAAQIEGLGLAAQAAPQTQSGISDTDYSALEGRLDEIARALVAVSNMGNKQPTMDLSAVDRVEARMSELAQTIDMIAARDHADELDTLAVRIDGLTERLGSFEKYAEKGDLGAANAMFAAPDTGVIEDQLRALNARVEEAAAHSQTQQLEVQIQQLHARVEEAATVNSTAAQMSNLEAQIGQIIRHLNKQSEEPTAAVVDFTPVEARLGQIETQIATSQNFSLEAAQQAAQQAVALMGSTSEPGQIISALSEDLKALHAVAESGNEHNTHTFSEVNATLEKVMQRLQSIEGTIEETARNAPVYQPAPSAAYNLTDEVSPHHNLEQAGHAPEGIAPSTQGADGELGIIHKAAMETGFVQPVAAPPLDPADHMDLQMAGGEAQPENNMPLEPGSIAPDLDRLVKEASEKLNAAKSGLHAEPAPIVNEPMHVAPEVDDVRPDAVAAARRALQATAAEMKAVRDDADVPVKASAKGLKEKVQGLIKGIDIDRLRKPVVMAAAALLLSIVAFKGYQIFAGDNDKPMAQIEAPAVKNDAAATTPGAEMSQELSTIADSERPVRKIGDVEATDNAAQENAGAEPQIATNEVDASSAQELTQPLPEAVDDGADNGEQSVASLGNEDETNPAVEASVPSQPETRIDVPASAGPAALVAAAASGNEKALFQLGLRYSDKVNNGRNMPEAAKWFEQSASLGFAPAQYSLGSLYEKGIGVEKNLAVASQWYEKAAAQGNARAMHNLAVINATGSSPDTKPDMDVAVGWFKQAADYGIKDSQFNLGILYGQGMGVPQNLIESYKWFALAAKTGDTDASKKRDEVANAMDPDDLDEARKAVIDWKPRKLDDATNRVSIPDEWRGQASSSASAGLTGEKALVQKAQAMLNQRGFEVGQPDGVMGPKTKRAIMEFQRSAGIPATGKVDKKLLSSLGINT